MQGKNVSLRNLIAVKSISSNESVDCSRQICCDFDEKLFKGSSAERQAYCYIWRSMYFCISLPLLSSCTMSVLCCLFLHRPHVFISLSLLRLCAKKETFLCQTFPAAWDGRALNLWPSRLSEMRWVEIHYNLLQFLAQWCWNGIQKGVTVQMTSVAIGAAV